MAALRTLKNLPEWLELDYFRRPRTLKALWRPVVWSTFGMATLVLVVLALLPRSAAPGLARIYQAGPVAPVHALFNDDCGKCHVEAFRTWDRLWHVNGAIRSVSDETCLQCHAGALHNGKMLHGGSCVSCHREHHGTTALARIPDVGCTHCHGNLTAALRPGTTTEFRDVSRFADHPLFAQRWQDAPHDPGTISFNHAVHLNPLGVTVPHDPAAGADPRTQRKVLTCGDCHQANEAGTVMQPIRYANHCATCHPLTVDVAIKAADAVGKQALDRFRHTSAPHVAPELVRAALRDRLTGLIRSTPTLLGSDPVAAPPARAIPGTPPRRPDAVSREEFAWVNQQLSAVERPLFWAKGQAGCAYCHERSNSDGPLPQFSKSGINERLFPGLGERREWFPHSVFKHDRHRMLDCTDCHAACTSRLTADVLMPGIDTCRRCHTGAGGTSAPSDCVNCHAYHPARQQKAFQGTLTIDQALAK